MQNNGGAVLSRVLSPYGERHPYEHETSESGSESDGLDPPEAERSGLLRRR